MNIPFSPPYIDEEVIREVTETLSSGWITTGPKVNALEHEVTKFTKCMQTLCVNSWTSGAILALKWFGIGPGDEVIVPAYTYAATALSVMHCGAVPVMADVKNDFTIDSAKIKSLITPKTKAIIPVDIAGWMCDYDSIYNIVNSAEIRLLFSPKSQQQKKLGRILVLADAAHSLGAQYKNKPSGSVADITVFSFHAVKNVTTAEGGAICLNLPYPFDNEEEYRLMRLWSLNGQSKDAFTKSQAGGWKYDILFQGLKVNMPDLCAALGLAQIKQYKQKLLQERRCVAQRYEDFFSKKEWAIRPPLIDSNQESSYHLYALRIKDISETQRDEMINFITELGVSVNVHFIPMPMLTLFKNIGYSIENFPDSYRHYSTEISLPIYPQLSHEAVDYICNAVEKAYSYIYCPV